MVLWYNFRESIIRTLKVKLEAIPKLPFTRSLINSIFYRKRIEKQF